MRNIQLGRSAYWSPFVIKASLQISKLLSITASPDPNQMENMSPCSFDNFVKKLWNIRIILEQMWDAGVQRKESESDSVHLPTTRRILLSYYGISSFLLSVLYSEVVNFWKISSWERQTWVRGWGCYKWLERIGKLISVPCDFLVTWYKHIHVFSNLDHKNSPVRAEVV